MVVFGSLRVKFDGAEVFLVAPEFYNAIVARSGCSIQHKLLIVQGVCKVCRDGSDDAPVG